MLKATCFFWSSTYNAFLFTQGPMSPTLTDVHMLIGLNIAGRINPFSLLETFCQAGQHKEYRLVSIHYQP
jgi:hypothetical protein